MASPSHYWRPRPSGRSALVSKHILVPNLSCLQILYFCKNPQWHVNLHTGVPFKEWCHGTKTWFYKRVDLFIHIFLCVVLDLPTTAPEWPNVSFGLHDDKVKVDSAPIPCQSSQTRNEPEVSADPTTSTGEETREDWDITLADGMSQYITVLCSTLQNTVYFTLHVTHNHYHPYLALFSGFF